MTVDTTMRTEQFLEMKGGALVVLSPETGAPIGRPQRIGATPYIVGRGGHCDLVLDDARVSTSHCELIAEEKGVRVVDLDSTNGTFVNNVRIENRNAVHVASDARLRCGQTWLALRYDGGERVPISTARGCGPLVGGSLAMRRIYAQLAKIAPHELNVLITGETGTGKELVAQAVHQASRRHAAPFITLDCTTIPASLAESTLFGHEKGAFTGAVTRHVSPFVAAQGGTLFFDELGELPPEIQPKLLRAVEARQIQSVGSVRYQPIDVRVVAATRRSLHAEMNAKRFRDDLYYRFAQVIIDLPPLRDRQEDIPVLVARFLAEMGDSGAMHRIDKPSMDRMMRHDWPGNIRELRNVVTVAHAHSAGGPIDVAEFLGRRTAGVHLSDPLRQAREFHIVKREALDALERDYVAKLHRETGGNLSEMSRRSGLSRSTLREYLERHVLRGANKCD